VLVSSHFVRVVDIPRRMVRDRSVPREHGAPLGVCSSVLVSPRIVVAVEGLQAGVVVDVRLHFVEPQKEAKSGDRVFRIVVNGCDVAVESMGVRPVRRALLCVC